MVSMNATITRFSQHRVHIVLILVALMVSLAVSIGAMFRYPSGPLMVAWGAIWSVGAGVAGYRLRSWFWPALCPLAMVAIVMAWEVVYGRTSWASTYVFMLGVTYTVPALLGAVVGTGLGRRRAGQSIVHLPR
jgi:hypothetical protein